MMKIRIFFIIIKSEFDITNLSKDVEKFINQLKETPKITWLSAAGKSFNSLTAVVEYYK